MPRDFLLDRLVASLRYSGIRKAKLLSAIAVLSALACGFPTLAAASLSDDSVWLATQAALLKIPKSEGQIALTLDSGNAPQTVAIDEVTGRTWVYSNRQLRSFGFDGAVLSRTLLPRSSGDDDANGDSDDRRHVALVVDPARGSIYLARHKTLYCFASDGTPINTTTLVDSVRGMAIDRTAGALFVAGKTNVAVYTSQLREALNFSSGTEDIRAIDFDPALAQLWVATHQSLRRYTATGERVFHLALGKIVHLAADGQGAVWALREKKLNRIDTSGLLLLDARLPIEAEDMTRAVGDVRDGSLWIAAKKQLLHINGDGITTRSVQLSSVTRDLALYADTFPPTLKWVSPEDGSYVNRHRPVFQFAISDRGLGVDAASVEIRLAGEKLATVCTLENTSATCTLQQDLPEGTLELAATVADVANNRSESTSLRFTVDTLAPQITVITPVNDSVTNNAMLTVAGNVSEVVALLLNGDAVNVDANFAFHHAVTLTEGMNNFVLVATDRAGNVSRLSTSVVLDTVPPVGVEINFVFATAVNDGLTTISGAEGSAEPFSRIKVTNLRTGEAVTVSADANGKFAATIGAIEGDILSIQVVDRAGNQSDVAEISLNGDLPPSPASVAPPLDMSVATNLYRAVEFIYAGSRPIQTGVQPGAIEPQRAALLRGKVFTRDNRPLSGVTITVMGHAEWGQTLSRAEGTFDLVINGGGLVTLNYEKQGYLPVQRKYDAAWQEYATLPDVVMIQLDPQVTTIHLAAATAMQVSRGSPVTDQDGTRQATLFFPQGMHAEMVLADGTTQALTTLNVRATEYTVGENGLKAMPGALPASSAYTYAVELSVDEAMAAGANDVRFDRPVAFYVDNFLDFPVGSPVPVGYYDRDKACWMPSDSGRIVKILSIDTAGLAVIDVTGKGQPATALELSTLGVTDAERAQLARLYQPGKSLWRSLITHFSPWDKNWPISPPSNAKPPKLPAGKMGTGINADKPCRQSGSIIECQNQTLGETVAVTGTPLTLNYSSDRVPGRKAAYTLHILLSDATLPSSLKRIDLLIDVAGRQFHHTAPASPHQSFVFVWDGKDAYGRLLQGHQAVTVRVGYVYEGVYMQTEQFGYSGNGIPMTGDVARQEVTLWQHNHYVMGQWRAVTLGGWSLNRQHSYDPIKHMLYLGTGERRSSQSLNAPIHTVAGNGVAGYSGDGGAATQSQLKYPTHSAMDAAGNIYIADNSNHVVRKIDRLGIITTIAGNGTQGTGGDGGPAIQAQFDYVQGLAVGRDGSVYVAEWGSSRVRRISPDGIIHTVAGNGTHGYSGDGGKATDAQLYWPHGIAVSEDCTLFITDYWNNVVRRVGPDGIITTVVGDGTRGGKGDNGPATLASLNLPNGIALDAEGVLYIAEYSGNRIRKVTPDGVITTVVGTGTWGSTGDGGPATEAQLAFPTDVAVGRDGSIYIPEYYGHRIRHVSQDGIITTLVGRGTRGYSANGTAASGAELNSPHGVSVGQDGSIYITEEYNHVVRRVSPPLPGFTGKQFAVASDDGSAVYEFDEDGKHLRTRNALTGAIVDAFYYDALGLLTRIVDAHGNATRIDYATGGVPIAVIAPDGQRTALSLDANGYVSQITNPADESVQFSYARNGLLLTMRDPKGGVSTMRYDTEGRLIHDANAAGGSWTLSRTDLALGQDVTLTSAENRSTQYQLEQLTTGDERSVITLPDGTRTESLVGTNGSATTTDRNGTVTVSTNGPDPRFGMQSPIAAITQVTTPSGLSSVISAARVVELADENNPFSLIRLRDQIDSNGYISTSEFDVATKTFTYTSAAGRQAIAVIDEQGKILSSRNATLEPTEYGYDARGRLISMHSGAGTGARMSAIAYNLNGYVDHVTDALGRTTSFDYDLAGRVTRQTFPDARAVQFSYDANGNITSIVPPGRDAHVFDYTAVNLEERYTPPQLDSALTITHYTYNRDKQLDLITRPDGQTVDLTYDAGGRVDSLITPMGQVNYRYHPASGQLATITANDGSTLDYTYDGFLPLTETYAGAFTGSVARVYDNKFRVSELHLNGEGIAYAYDNDDLVANAGALSLDRDPAHGLLTGTTLGNVTTRHRYSSFGELSDFRADHAGTPLVQQHYNRDALGRIQEKIETIDGVTTLYRYGYDLAGRLVTVAKNGVPTARYEYDANGNRIGSFNQAGAINANVDAQDRLVSYNGGTYLYTLNGELTAKIETGQTTQYTYDVFGNLTHVTLPNGTSIDYVIDGRNRRIGKKINGVLVQGFLYQDQLEPIAELDANGNIVARFIYGSSTHSPDYMIKDGTTYRIISDHLGSPKLIVDTATGAIAQRIDYDEFGNITQDTNPGFQPFGFAGGIYDQHTMLTRFGARDYDAKTGRWTAKDPIGFGGGDGNLYGYVLNNPLSYIDPLGLETTVITVRDYGIGTHSALLVTTPGQPSFLYDPAGSYVPPSRVPRGSGDFFEGPDANLSAYSKFHERLGSSVEATKLPTTPKQEQEIIDRAVRQGGAIPFSCTAAVSKALGSACGISPSSLPGSLAGQARNAQCP